MLIYVSIYKKFRPTFTVEVISPLSDVAWVTLALVGAYRVHTGGISPAVVARSAPHLGALV